MPRISCAEALVVTTVERNRCKNCDAQPQCNVSFAYVYVHCRKDHVRLKSCFLKCVHHTPTSAINWIMGNDRVLCDLFERQILDLQNRMSRLCHDTTR